LNDADHAMISRLRGCPLLLLALAACGQPTSPAPQAQEATTTGQPPAQRPAVEIFELAGGTRPDGTPFVVRTPTREPMGKQLTTSASPTGSLADWPASQAEGEVPRLAFEALELDLGEVWEGETVEARFPFRNSGGAPLEFGEIRPSCGCTTTALPRNRYEAGEGDALALSWHTKGFGHQTKTVLVRSNAVDAPLVTLRISAQVRQFAQFTPQPLRLGELEQGQSHTARVVLTCLDPDFELLDLSTGSPLLAASEAGRRPDGGREIEVSVAESAPWGALSAVLRARIAGRRPGQDEVVQHTAELIISSTLVGNLRVEPPFFAVGQVEPRARVHYVVQLTHRSRAPFRVLDARVESSQPPGLGVRPEPAADGSVRLVLEGDVGDYLGLIRATVVLETDIPGEQTRRLPVQGMVR